MRPRRITGIACLFLALLSIGMTVLTGLITPFSFSFALFAIMLGTYAVIALHPR